MKAVILIKTIINFDSGSANIVESWDYLTTFTVPLANGC